MTQDKQKFQTLSPEDVISVSDIKAIGKIWSTTTATTEELRKRAGAVFGVVNNSDDPCHEWFDNGIKGKVLIAEKGGGWKEGRIRFSVEFLPDESTQIESLPDKPTVGLDEFR